MLNKSIRHTVLFIFEQPPYETAIQLAYYGTWVVLLRLSLVPEVIYLRSSNLESRHMTLTVFMRLKTQENKIEHNVILLKRCTPPCLCLQFKQTKMYTVHSPSNRYYTMLYHMLKEVIMFIMRMFKA